MGWPDVNYADIRSEVHIKHICTGREGHLSVSSCRAYGNQMASVANRNGRYYQASGPHAGRGRPGVFLFPGIKRGALPSSPVAAGGADQRRLLLIGAEMDGRAYPWKAKTAF